MLQQLSQSIQSQLLKQQQPRIVQVYIRIVTTRSVKISLPSEVKVALLKQIIKEKFQIQIENQILFLKGVNINGVVLLQNNWIIHVIDKQLIQSQFISFHLKTQSLNQIRNQMPTYYTVKSDSLLLQFIQKNILKQYSVRLNEILFVQSGRFLKPNQSFKSQYVQSSTQITLLHMQKDKNVSSTHSQKQFSLAQSKFSGKKNENLELKFKKKDQPKIRDKVFLTERIEKTSKKVTDKDNQVQVENLKQNYSNSQSAKKIRMNSPIAIQKNKCIPVGKKQCNCKHKKHKQGKFISYEDRKKRQKEIRQMNYQKTISKKQKQIQQNHQSNSLILEQNNFQNHLKSSLNQSISEYKLKKVKSQIAFSSYSESQISQQSKNHICQNQEELFVQFQDKKLNQQTQQKNFQL